jgi:hypothetical protein
MKPSSTGRKELAEKASRSITFTILKNKNRSTSRKKGRLSFC